MPFSLHQAVFDQWWDQALDIALARTKAFILHAQMGFDAERPMLRCDLVCDTDDSDAAPVFLTSPHTHLQHHKFLKFAEDLCDFPDPVLLASQFSSRNEII